MNDFPLKYKKMISIFIWSIINTVFIFKYSYRISLEISIFFVVIYLLGIWCFYYKYKKRTLFTSSNVWWLLGISITILSYFAFSIIPIDSLGVDRWKMIKMFWESTLNGIYPYSVSSSSGNYPGPMPFYFIMIYPFYLLKEIGWLGVVGFWMLFLYVYHKRQQLKPQKYTILMLCLFSTILVYYEIITRSTILVNSVIFIFYYLGLKKLSKFSTTNFYLYAILGGVIFSTRNIFVIPMILWGIGVLFNKEITCLRFVKWVLCFILSFILTFIPFIVLNPSAFIEYNPFITQSSIVLPFVHTLSFIVLTIIISIIIAKKIDITFMSLILLFAIITDYVICAIYDCGIRACLIGKADIAYYGFCIPFIFEILMREKNDK